MHHRVSWHTSNISRTVPSSVVQRCGRCPRVRAQTDDFFEVATPEAEPIMLFRKKSPYNFVRVVEIPDHPLVDPCISEMRGARIMVLDGEGNVHSIWKPHLQPDAYLTQSSWDLLATLPSLSPDGTIGILGLAAGTIARMIHAHYPQQHMAGWELDPVVVEAARLHMGLADIEASGKLVVCHTGDALVAEAAIDGGFAGIMVDIFADGCLPVALTQESTWEGIRQRLTPGVGARVMANLGQSPRQLPGRQVHPDAAVTALALNAMSNVFGGEISLIHIRNMDGHETENCVALSGPFEGLQESWQAHIPQKLKHLTLQYTWERYEA